MLLSDLYEKKHTKNHDPDDWLKYKQIRNEINAKMKTKRNSTLARSWSTVVVTSKTLGEF